MRTLKILSAALISGSLGFVAQAEDKVVKPVNIISAESTPGTESKTPEPAPVSKVQSTEVYPDGALMNIYQEELFEIKKTEDAERRAAKARDEYEHRKVEAEKEITAKKYKIEGFKLKQEQVAAEVDAMNTELKDLETKHKDTEEELARIESKAQEHLVQADKVKKDLESTKKI